MKSKHQQKSINDPGYVYILHFTDKLANHAQHYIGFSKTPMDRMMNHIAGYTRVRIIEACHEQGIGMVPAAIIPVPTRRSERALKAYKGAKYFCKYCNPKTHEEFINRFIRREVDKHDTRMEVTDGTEAGQS